MEFIETRTFTERIGSLGLEVQLRAFQNALLDNPEAGDLDPGTGGLRKVRMADPTRGKGKRGGVRIHYLYLPHIRRVYLLYVYGKNEADGLTLRQKERFRGLARQVRHEGAKWARAAMRDGRDG